MRECRRGKNQGDQEHDHETQNRHADQHPEPSTQSVRPRGSGCFCGVPSLCFHSLHLRIRPRSLVPADTRPAPTGSHGRSAGQELPRLVRQDLAQVQSGGTGPPRPAYRRSTICEGHLKTVVRNSGILNRVSPIAQSFMISSALWATATSILSVNSLVISSICFLAVSRSSSVISAS